MDPQLLVPLTQVVQQLEETNRSLARTVVLMDWLAACAAVVMLLCLASIAHSSRLAPRAGRSRCR